MGPAAGVRVPRGCCSGQVRCSGWTRCSGLLTCLLLFPKLGEVTCEKVSCQQACPDRTTPRRDCCSSCPGRPASVTWSLTTVFFPLCSSQKHRTCTGLDVTNPGSERECGPPESHSWLVLRPGPCLGSLTRVLSRVGAFYSTLCHAVRRVYLLLLFLHFLLSESLPLLSIFFLSFFLCGFSFFPSVF